MGEIDGAPAPFRFGRIGVPMTRFSTVNTLLVVATLTTSTLGQTTWHVDDDATPPGVGTLAQPFPAIAAAIAVASPGDTVLIADGVYSGFSFDGKDIVVRSANGPGTVVVLGTLPSGDVVEITSGEGPGAVLDGLTVYGAGTFPWSWAAYALRVSGSSPTVRNCAFLGSGVPSYGVRVESAAGGPGVLFEDVVVGYFDDQTGQSDWTGLYVAGPGTFRRCEIVLNSSSAFFPPGPNAMGGGGCGLYAVPASGFPAAPPVFEDCDVVGNVGANAVGNQGGYGGASGDAVFRRCRIQGNTGGYGAFLDDPPFSGPGSGGHGGVSGFRSLTDCVVSGNFGGGSDNFPGSGGLEGSGPLVNCTVAGNGNSASILGVWRNCIVRDNGPPGSITTVSPFAVVEYCNVDAVVAGVGNFNAPESFVNPAFGDYRLTQFSPSVNAGDPSGVGVGSADVDGEPRIFGGRVDAGADEHTGALVDLPAAAGNVGDASGVGGPFDILKINGSPGYSGRTVEAPTNTPLTFELAAPPGVAAPFNYALCGMFGVPDSSSAYPSAFGQFLFLPAPIDPAASGFFLLASNVGFTAPAPIVPTPPAPLIVVAAAGLPTPITMTLQAAVDAGGAFPGDLRISNGIVLSVY
jgi:hypothetical protein